MAADYFAPADPAVRDIIAANHPELKDVFETVASPDITPDKAAQVIKLSGQTGQPAAFVEENLAGAQLAARSKQLDSVWGEIDAKRPVSKRFFMDTSKMAIAHDDAEHLSGIEGMITDAAAWQKTKLAHLELATLSQEYSAARYAELHPGQSEFPSNIFPTRLAAQLMGVSENQPDVFGSVPRTRQIQSRMDEITKSLPAESRITNDMVEALPFLANMLTASGAGATAGGVVGAIPALEAGPLAFLTGAAGARIGGKAAAGDFFYRQGYVSTYDRLSRERDKNGQAIPEDRIRVAAAVNGALQAGLSWVELGELLPKGTSPKLIKALSKPGAIKAALTEFLGNSAHAAAAMSGFHAADIVVDEYAKAFENARGADFQHTTLKRALVDTLHAGASGALVFSPLSALNPVLGLRSSLGEVEQARRTKETLTSLMDGKKDSKLNARMPELYEKFNGDALAGTPQENVHIDREAAERLFQQDGVDPAKQFEAMGLSQEYELSKATGEPIKIPTAKWLSDSVPAQLPRQLLEDTKIFPEHKTVNQIKQIVLEESAKLEEQGKRLQQAQQEAVSAIEKDPELAAVHASIMADARKRISVKVPEVLGLKDREKWLDANARIVADHYLVETQRRKVGDAMSLYQVEFPRVLGDKGRDINGDGTYVPPTDEQLRDQFAAQEFEYLQENGGVTPALDAIRTAGGLDWDVIKKSGMAGDLQDLNWTGIFKKGGLGLDDMANAISQEGVGVLKARDIGELIERIKEDAARIKAFKGKYGDKAYQRVRDGLYQREPESAPAFYHKLQRDIEKKIQGKTANVEQIEAILRETKGEERDWSQIDKFLYPSSRADKTRQISKAELLDFLRANQLEVREVLKGENGNLSPEEVKKLRLLVETANEDGIESLTEGQADILRELQARKFAGAEGGEPKYEDYQLPGGENYRELLLTMPDEQAAQLSDLRKQMVAEEIGKGDWQVRIGDTMIGNLIAASSAEDAISRTRLQPRDLPREFRPENFQSSHFDEPNIFAHVRFNDRVTHEMGYAAVNLKSGNKGPTFATEAEALAYQQTLPAGTETKIVAGTVPKKVLFLEEVQSDWHQKGRRSGYKSDAPDTMALQNEADALGEKIEALRDKSETMQGPIVDQYVKNHPDAIPTFEEWWDKGPQQGHYGSLSRMSESDREGWRKNYEENLPRIKNSLFFDAVVEGKIHDAPYDALLKEMKELRAERESIRQKIGNSKGAVPDGPFKKTWHEFALKRMIRYAAENGYDRIAWTTGEQQAERYDLSKQVDVVSYLKTHDGEYDLNAIEKGTGNTVVIGVHPAARLADVVGKELADRIIADEGEPTGPGGAWRRFKGEDLKIGGEGMKGFYDKIIPSFLNKFGKKFGAEVGKSIIETHGKDADLKGIATELSHSMPITPELKRAALNEGFSLFQAAKNKAPNGEYVPDLNEIHMGKNANPTTFIHEFFHGAAQHMFDFVTSGQADEEYLAHWQPMAEFLGIKEGQTKLTVEQQEKGARAWERYLRGEQDAATRAPSEDLAGTFSLFRNWFSKVYRNIKNSPIAADVSVDAKAFFDRMLATDEEIARAHQESGYNAAEMLDIPDMAEPARRELRTEQQRARAQVEEALLREQVAELRDENKKRLTEMRAETQRAVEVDLADQPLYRAMEEIREKAAVSGKADGPFGHDLTAATLADRFLKGKAHPEVAAYFETIAEVFDFADGHELAGEIVAAPSFEFAVKAKVDELMLPFADLKNTEKIREAALKAIHSDRMTDVLFMEARVLSNMQGDKLLREEVSARTRFESRLAAEAARAQAREILGGKPIKDATNFRAYITAEKNAAMRFAEFKAKGDGAKAAQAKGQQAMNHALAAEAYRLREQVARNERFLEKFIQRGPDLKDMPYGFVRQIDAMLSQFGLRPPKGSVDTFLKIARDMLDKGEGSDDIANATGFRLDEKSRLVPETLADLVDRISEDAQIVFIPDILMNGREKLQSEMTPRDLSDLKDGIQTISSVGRNFLRFISRNLKGDVAEAAASLNASILMKVGTPYADKMKIGSGNDTAFADKLGRIMNLPDAVIPSMVNLLTVCEFLDGRDPEGPAKAYIYRPLKEAGDRKLARHAQMNKDVNAIFEKHFTVAEMAEYKNRREFFPFLDRDKDGKEKGRYLTHEEILMIALNWGNEGNKDRIRKGFGIDDTQVLHILDTLQEPAWRFTQDIWNHLQTYWPEIVKLETLVNGVEPKGVEPTPLNTRYGALKGGYFPIAYDFARSEDAYRTTEQKNALFKQYSSAAAHTDNGHTKSRVDSLKRPIRLSMDVLFNHLENIVHDLEFRPAVIDVSRFLRTSDAKSAITNALGVDGMRKITMELKDAASDQGEFLSLGDKAFRWFRFNSTFATLALRAFTLPMDLSGNVIISAWEIGGGRTAGALKDFAMNPHKMKEFAEANSTRMARRAQIRDRDLADLSKKWSGEGSSWKQFGFIFQQISDEAVSVPLWNEVYQRSLDKHGHDRSVQIADDAVTRSFGSGARIDQVGAQKGGEFGKVTSMYYSWLSMMFNRCWIEGKMAGLEYNQGNTGAAMAIIAKTAFFAWGLQAANENLWRELFRNGQQEDPEGRAHRIVGRTLHQPFSYIWIVRDMAGYGIDQALGAKSSSYRMTPLESSIESILKPFGMAANIAFSEGKEYDEKLAEASARSAALMLGYPQKLNDMSFNFIDWMQNEGEATWRDLLTRRTKK
jgi:hypothetical protein